METSTGKKFSVVWTTGSCAISMFGYRAQANMKGRWTWLERWGLSLIRFALLLLIVPAPVHRLGVGGEFDEVWSPSSWWELYRLIR
jgi:hypothetical protein